MLTSAEFHTTIRAFTPEHLPGLSAETNWLQQAVYRSLRSAACLADESTTGWRGGEHLAGLFFLCSSAVHFVHAEVKTLRVQLCSARKQANLPPRLHIAGAPGLSATEALVNAAFRIINVGWTAAHAEVRNDIDAEAYDQLAADDDDTFIVPEYTTLGDESGLYFRSALNVADGSLSSPAFREWVRTDWTSHGWNAIGNQLRKRLGTDFVYPDPASLLHEMQVELMALDGLLAPTVRPAVVADDDGYILGPAVPPQDDLPASASSASSPVPQAAQESKKGKSKGKASAKGKEEVESEPAPLSQPPVYPVEVFQKPGQSIAVHWVPAPSTPPALAISPQPLTQDTAAPDAIPPFPTAAYCLGVAGKIRWKEEVKADARFRRLLQFLLNHQGEWPVSFKAIAKAVWPRRSIKNSYIKRTVNELRHILELVKFTHQYTSSESSLSVSLTAK